jgi:hypothetical protein
VAGGRGIAEKQRRIEKKGEKRDQNDKDDLKRRGHF